MNLNRKLFQRKDVNRLGVVPFNDLQWNEAIDDGFEKECNVFSVSEFCCNVFQNGYSFNITMEQSNIETIVVPYGRYYFRQQFCLQVLSHVKK